MKNLLLFLFIAFQSLPVFGSDVFHYTTTVEKTGETVEEVILRYEALAEGRKKITWKAKRETRESTSEYVITPQNEIVRWKIHDPEAKNQYHAIKDKGQVKITGKLDGKEIQKTILFDKYPLIVNPKFEFQPFIESGKESFHFWSLRQDKLTKHKMVAKISEPEKIIVNGQPVQAIRVEWNAPGWRSIYFNRTYWFRESDKHYLKQVGSNGYLRELIS